MKTITGTVVSTKMDKTISVLVTRQWVHPKYKKAIKRTKKYLVHDEKEQAQINDQVIFSPTKPISKRKQFTLTSIIQKSS